MDAYPQPQWPHDAARASLRPLTSMLRPVLTSCMRPQTDIITKLGLLDYHEVAWKTSQYGRIWEYLRRDFDVEVRTITQCILSPT